MGDDAGFSEPRDDAMGDVAGALRGAAREHQHVADCKRRAHGSFEGFFVVDNGAEKHRVAAVLGNRRGDDRAIAVVDRGGAQRRARLHQFVAGGDDSNPDRSRDRNLRDAAGRQHADLARADHGAGAQQSFAARDVGTGVGDVLPG